MPLLKLPQDYAMAMFSYQKAAEQGNHYAQFDRTPPWKAACTLDV